VFNDLPCLFVELQLYCRDTVITQVPYMVSLHCTAQEVHLEANVT